MSTSPEKTPVTVRRWLAGPLPKDVESALTKVQKLPDVRHVAVMPDAHLAREVCVGTVLATTQTVYPAAVGGDIGCGMAAVAFDCGADVLASASAADRVFGSLGDAIPINRHHRARELPHDLQSAALSHPRLEAVKRRDARVQFGTLGRGNHFLEFQSDAEGRLWLMVHSGSRAVGPAIRDHHLACARGSTEKTADVLEGLLARAENVPTFVRTLEGRPGQAGEEGGPAAGGPEEGGSRAVVDQGSISPAAGGALPGASRYLSDAAWARAYADASRRAMLDAAAGVVASLFGGGRLKETLVTCDHNHVRRETHFGRELWVHRKGAASAREGEPGIIPGSMGTASYLVQGRGNADSLCSSAHGAGRAMSRDEARRRVSTRDLSRQLRDVWFDPRAALALREEAPSAYKDIGAVMRAQRDLVRITRTLRPVLSYKAR